jgi:hypothetical protein
MHLLSIYRISDKGFLKTKVDGVSKVDSLKNFIKEFSGNSKIILVADNCEDKTVEHIKSITTEKIDIHRTYLGNSKSFMYCIKLALESKMDFFYFCEDDYIHKVGAVNTLLIGLKNFDYVTLYDHPDKYTQFSGPLNGYAKKNKYSETTEILKIKNQIWRTTNSCTLTFGTNRKVLTDDKKILEKAVLRKKGPWGMIAFNFLTKQKIIFRSYYIEILFLWWKNIKHPRRYIGIPIPGYATHLETIYLADDFNLPLEI